MEAINTWWEEAKKEVYAQRIDKGGKKFWRASGIKLSNGHATGPAYACFYGNGSASFAMNDDRAGNRDVYAQQAGVTYLPSYHFAEGFTGENFQTYLCLLNPNQNPVTAVVTFMVRGESPASREVPLAPRSRTTLVVNGIVGPGKELSMRVTPREDFIVAERPMYFNDAYMWKGGHCVLGTTSPGTTWCFAEGTTRVGFDEYLTIQNPSDSTANVEVVYLLQGGGEIPKTLHMDPHSRETVYVVGHLGRGTQNQGIDHSTLVRSDAPIVCERPMYFVFGGWDGGHCVMGMGR
ncbi:MAG: hypothetical protein H5T95_14090 [Firmicutes bacterium]|nr:hypothetical protein [Bacillota bacterium]